MNQENKVLEMHIEEYQRNKNYSLQEFVGDNAEADIDQEIQSLLPHLSEGDRETILIIMHRLLESRGND